MRTCFAIAILAAATATTAVANPMPRAGVAHTTAAPATPRPGAGNDDVTRMVTDDCARARKAGKTCVLEVPAEDVGGQAPTADQIGITLLTFGPHSSLIRVRHDFIPEIVKTAEDL